MIEISFQPTVSRLLSNAINKGRLHSAYLFVGDEGCGKWYTAIEFASKILSIGLDSDASVANTEKRVRGLAHPDLHLLFPMPSPKNKREEVELPEIFRQAKLNDPFAAVEFDRPANILFENVRAVRWALGSSAAEGGYRVAVVHEIEKMPETSFDILLKTVEEPPSETVMILTTNNVNRLPATIISRCQKVRFLPITASHIRDYLTGTKGIDSAIAEKMAFLSNGSFTEAFRLVSSDIDSRRELAVSLLGVFVTGNRAASMAALIDCVNLRSRDEALDLIRSWTWLLRDVSLVREGVTTTQLINGDLRGDLEAMAARFSGVSSIHEAMIELLETKKLFYRNVSPRLALTRFAWKLNEIACS